jgi:hypothetical protein
MKGEIQKRCQGETGERGNRGRERGKETRGEERQNTIDRGVETEEGERGKK